MMDLLNLSAAALSTTCLSSFDRCFSSSPSGKGANHEIENTNIQGTSSPLVYRLADFNLWIDGTGALASHKASLDWRLKERPIDLNLVKGNLVMLHQFTEDYADLQTKRLLLDEALRNIDSSLANLSSLAVAIRRTGRKARLFKADSRFNDEEHVDLKLHLQCIIALRPSQESRGDESLDTLSPIQRRLIQANLIRRNRFLQAQKHSVRLKRRIPDSIIAPIPLGDSSHLETTIQHPSPPGHHDRDSPSAPDQSSEIVDIRKPAPTLSGTSASIPSSKLQYVDPTRKKSEGSISHTEITRIAASTHYPRPQMPSTDQQVFQCPCCCQMLSVEEFRSDDKWRKHLGEDICPYTCFLEACPTPYVLYTTRAALEYHIRQDHQPTWQCPICDDQPMFTTKTGTRDHAYQYHQAILNDSDETEDYIEGFLSTFTQHLLAVDTCPLCQEAGPIDSPELIDHVMEHVHEFSLRSLPWPRPSEIDLGGEVGSFNPACDASFWINKWLEDLKPHHDLGHKEIPSHQLSRFDHNRLAIISDPNATAQTDDGLVEICFADEHGDESAVAETDISPLTQGSLPSFSDSAGALPSQEESAEAEMQRQPPDENAEGLEEWLRKSDEEIQDHGAPLNSPSTITPRPGILKRSRDWMLRTLFAREIDITMVGLQGCGKTSLLRTLAGGEFTIDSIPTVGFNMKRIQKNNVTIKCWDLGGQPRFRPMWERYCRGVGCIVFVVDISDAELIPVAKEELHTLMGYESTQGIPLLVLGNHSERPDKLTVDELIERLDLKSLKGRAVTCYGISAKEETNLDAVVDFLIQLPK